MGFEECYFVTNSTNLFVGGSVWRENVRATTITRLNCVVRPASRQSLPGREVWHPTVARMMAGGVLGDLRFAAQCAIWINHVAAAEINGTSAP
jgi:hypothetical protein